MIVDMWHGWAQSLRDQQRLELRQVEAQACATAAKALQQALARYYEALEVPPLTTTSARLSKRSGCAAIRTK